MSGKTVNVKQELHRGCLPFSEVKLQFNNYLVPAKLPPIPAVFGHVANNYAWGMLGNDSVGDCVLAGAAHEEMLWHIAGRKTVPVFTNDIVVKQYLSLAGGKDDGLDPVATAKWRCTTGLLDANGTSHKLHAFAQVDTVDNLLTAAYLFGAAGIGLKLPANAELEFAKGHPWVLGGMPRDAHYVPLVGRNSHGNLIVISWGRLQAVALWYAKRYFLGGLAYMNLDYLRASGLSPEGINEQQLEADLGSL